MSAAAQHCSEILSRALLVGQVARVCCSLGAAVLEANLCDGVRSICSNRSLAIR